MRITSRKKKYNKADKIQVWKTRGGRFEVNALIFPRGEQVDLV